MELLEALLASSVAREHVNAGVVVQAISHETPAPAMTVAPPPQKRLNRVLDACILILRNNPALCEKSGRDLEMSVQVEGKTVSYKTWNEAKKQMRGERDDME